MWQSINWRSNPEGIPGKFSKLQRLLSGDAQQVAKVNEEIQKQCRGVLADVGAWREKNKKSRTPTSWILLALRAPDKLTAETHAIIRETLKAIDLGSKEAGYIGWMHVNGANGANVHGYLTPLVLAPALIDDPKVLAAGEQALLAELGHMNRTGDMGEFNLLESHWCGTASWEDITRYIPDPKLRRMARLIRERLWINRFLTWSPAVERITGPGSRMAPSEWLGCDYERALFATGLKKPIWINYFFPWDGWDSRAFRHYPGAPPATLIPDLPSYLNDLASQKSLPNELQCRLTLTHGANEKAPYRNNFKLEGIDQPPANLKRKYVNYQGRGYTLGSTTWSWIVNTCVVNASAWWNNSAIPWPLGDPERFCVLYPHYVINGMSFLDKGDVYYEEKDGQPLADSKGGPRGPWIASLSSSASRHLAGSQHAATDVCHGRPGMHKAEIRQRQSPNAPAPRCSCSAGPTAPTASSSTANESAACRANWRRATGGSSRTATSMPPSRPLEATRLRGQNDLEKRTPSVVLYQDNVAMDNITGIADADWIKAHRRVPWWKWETRASSDRCRVSGQDPRQQSHRR